MNVCTCCPFAGCEGALIYGWLIVLRVVLSIMVLF